MNKLIPLLAFLLILLFSGFDDDPAYYDYTPVFMDRGELETSIKLEPPRGIENPGKIYIKDGLIFINEKYRGIHVVDNINPEEPENFAFIHIDGCIDLAMNGHVLYADNAVDLVSISLSAELTGLSVTSRIKNVFPELKAPDGRELSDKEKMARPENSILVRWEQK